MVWICAEEGQLIYGTKKRGRPRRKFMDVVTEDVQTVCVTEEDARVK